MNASYSTVRWTEHEELINVRALCEAFCRQMAALCMKHGVRWTLEVDPTLEFWLSPLRVRETLQHLVHASLRRMPEGGHLDWTAVLTPRGLELEVADTGEGPRETTPRGEMASRSVGDRASRVTVECHFCPQGGMAHTLIIPWSASAGVEWRGRRRAA